MGISAKELAEKLSISAATVSMVFNNKPGISETTKTLVLEAADRYGYQYKKLSEANTPGTILFIIYKKHGEIVNDTPFFSQVTEGITGQCRQEDFLLQISFFYENEDFQKQIANIESLEHSGILLLGTEMDLDGFKHFKGLDAPIVLLDCYNDEMNVDSVLINNIQGAFLATSHLLENGHDSAGYLKSNVLISNFAERADGYYKALRHHNIPTSHPYVFAITPTAEQGYRDMIRILDNSPDLPSAFFADNDIIAAAAIRAFQEKGFHIPEDISIIGFDDLPICQLIEPPLSTMNVQKKKLGALAVSRLVDKIKNKNGEIIKIAISTELIERSSVLNR